MTQKRLTRSTNKLVAGVCGGIANYLGWDTTLVRLFYVLLSLVSAAFPGFFIYVILWIIMPNEEY